MKVVAKFVNIVDIPNVINMKVLTYLFCPECGYGAFDTRGWSFWNPKTNLFELFEVDEHYCSECDTYFIGPIKKKVIHDETFKVL